MIESKLKVKNANSGQLFRPDWVSLAECMPLSCRCPVKVFHFYVVSALQFIVFANFKLASKMSGFCQGILRLKIVRCIQEYNIKKQTKT